MSSIESEISASEKAYAMYMDKADTIAEKTGLSADMIKSSKVNSI
jgi:hypothetical protein